MYLCMEGRDHAHPSPYYPNPIQQHTQHPKQVKEGRDYAEWLCKEEGMAIYTLKYRLGPDGCV